ncbi:ATP-binding protein [Sphaerisporangium sp. TRM90804]|uniref:ATP-binding protein n=1 Tax=Sphaerisporangium sp. TRM90804 TaxID=3031113 RepID=UPI0024470072|nr:ATP-binding protein [Sphaerisporangium sp. TRM90804]MDH2429713.1 ATP-binding protein [Sphaerisporangium sp. TRM90804]
MTADPTTHPGPAQEEARVTADPITLPGPLGEDHPSRSAPINESVRLGPEVLIWRRAFPGRADQASEARRFVRFLLGSTLFADDAELIVGELAGNAIRHTRSGPPDGRFTVEITLTSARHEPLTTPATAVNVLITVYDLGGGGTPLSTVPDRRDSCEESGRGLAIVTALADRTGHQGTPTTGHSVWAYLSGEHDPRPARTGGRTGTASTDGSGVL